MEGGEGRGEVTVRPAGGTLSLVLSPSLEILLKDLKMEKARVGVSMQEDRVTTSLLMGPVLGTGDVCRRNEGKRIVTVCVCVGGGCFMHKAMSSLWGRS